MLQRYVFIKLADTHANPDGRDAMIESAKSLLATSPGVGGLMIGKPADDRALEAWDLMFVIQLESRAAAELFRTSPGHRQFVDEHLTPKLGVVKSWNFDVE